MIRQLALHEGLRLKPYKCTSGALTIGYGRNLDARGITEAEAEMMLSHDIDDFQDRLLRDPMDGGAVTCAPESAVGYGI